MPSLSFGLRPVPCDFCSIVNGTLPRELRYEDDSLMAFRNRLTWAPVMLLVVPRRHMTQHEFWRSPLFSRAAVVAVRLGTEDCPAGFRLLSNFGRDALQTQAHGHLHVIGGAPLGLYVSRQLVGQFDGPDLR